MTDKQYIELKLVCMLQAKLGELTEKNAYPMHDVDAFVSFMNFHGSAKDAALAEQIAQINSIQSLGWFFVKNHLALEPKIEPIQMVVENSEYKQVSNL